MLLTPNILNHIILLLMKMALIGRVRDTYLSLNQSPAPVAGIAYPVQRRGDPRFSEMYNEALIYNSAAGATEKIYGDSEKFRKRRIGR